MPALGARCRTPRRRRTLTACWATSGATVCASVQRQFFQSDRDDRESSEESHSRLRASIELSRSSSTSLNDSVKIPIGIPNQRRREAGVCAVLRTPTKEACPPAMRAAIEGGFKLVEFTMTTPGCLDTLSDFRTLYPDVMIGCGALPSAPNFSRALWGEHFSSFSHRRVTFIMGNRARSQAPS